MSFMLFQMALVLVVLFLSFSVMFLFSSRNFQTRKIVTQRLRIILKGDSFKDRITFILLFIHKQRENHNSHEVQPGTISHFSGKREQQHVEKEHIRRNTSEDTAVKGRLQGETHNILGLQVDNKHKQAVESAQRAVSSEVLLLACT